MRANPLALPTSTPSGYEPLPDEPEFDPARHLALEPPERVWTLKDFGYSEEEIRASATPIAVTGPIRVLSKAGADAARTVALALKSRSQTGDRTAHYLTGGVYRSKFLRDLCASRELTQFLSQVIRCEVLPHSMPSQQVYINYAPEDLSRAVDTWHADSIGMDTVVMVTDPTSFSGGRFQFFEGTTQEAARLLGTSSSGLTAAITRDLPPERVVTVEFPAAGYAIFQQGSMVIHRATRLLQRAERITMVFGYVAGDVVPPDPTRDSIAEWEEAGIIAEYARHKAWLSATKLEHLIRELNVNAPRADICRMLGSAIADAQRALAVLREGSDRDKIR